MLQKLSLRKAIKTVIFLLTCFCMTGCYTLKTVFFNNIPADKKILVIHADQSYWAAENYNISEGVLTATLCSDSVKIRKSDIVNIYVAPVSSVVIDGTRLTVPVANIGKTDYHTLSIWNTLGLIVVSGAWIYFIISTIID